MSLAIFGIAFGFVEAAVVVYLRTLITFHFNQTITHYHVIVNLGFITFVHPTHELLLNHHLTSIEVTRETATIIMLVAVAWVASRSFKQWLGAFMIGFACWDLSYYGFLRIIDHWPQSLLTRDVYFLIPVTWIGPVITPILISTALLVGGVWLYRQRP